MKPKIALIGIGGYGRVHLRHLLDFHSRGELALAAVVALPADRAPEVVETLQPIGCRLYQSLPDMVADLPKHPLDLAIVTTPIHLHADMSIALLQADVNVLVEKPLTASFADAERIAEAAAVSGRRIAVGFQYLHAPEIRALRHQLHQGAIGPLASIRIHGAWPRSHAYYSRNDWAGRLSLNGSPVLDSPINNAMSHFVMLALHLGVAPGQSIPPPSRVSAELYRIQRIESFDTAVVRAEMPDGPNLEIYCTHSSEHIAPPRLSIVGQSGHAEWIQDRFAAIESPDGFSWRQEAQPEFHTRERMLRDVLASLNDPAAFVCQPDCATAHVRLVETLHRHVPITPVPPALSRQRHDGEATYTFLPGLDKLLASAANSGSHLTELGAAWAVEPVTFCPEESIAP